ncbi:hypothetical protein [Sandaracinus amylolyticus]|uniref:Tryptophan synthase alpha chain n=1 Tax=Sandaracinus amylolyticus TaxID=927083 RepID=A0A0F6SH63_9BACT|nr:hypothetical protein [Sandaracinus amylolyticus]AKF09894.1 hypothetical protein DB32_007043 [Sandaracinus amylolyticus]
MCSKLVVSSVLALLALSISACGNDSMSPPPGMCGSPGRDGRSDCSGVTTCNAGQYCDDSGVATCTPGCTSDSNCGPNEFCARPVGEAIGACQSCPVCGNGSCESGETASSCASDCTGGPQCGNGSCEPGESAASCASDCASAPVCGDGLCEPGEGACAADCGVGPRCGNGVCEAGESAASCPPDCAIGPVCGDGVCEPGEACPGDCTDVTLAECLEHCDAYNFFECFAPGGLQTCRDLCDAASMASREQFDSCASTRAVSCDESCFEFLQ